MDGTKMMMILKRLMILKMLMMMTMDLMILCRHVEVEYLVRKESWEENIIILEKFLGIWIGNKEQKCLVLMILKMIHLECKLY